MRSSFIKAKRKTMFTQKFSELPLWQVLIGAAVLFIAILVVKDLVTVDNIVATSNNGSFLRKSYFSPLSAAKKTEIGAKADAAIAESAAKSAAKA